MSPPGVNKHSPQFQAAWNACHSLLPQGQGSQTSAADKASFLRNSACVRAHGVLGYPDPVFFPGGGMVISLPPGMDDNSPLPAGAEKACQGDQPADAPKGG
jgi:hypothetical protein